MRNIREMMISITTDGDDSELDMLRMDLSEEMSILPINAIEPVTSGKVPASARGLDAVGLGKLIVKAGPDKIKRVVKAVHSWLQRSAARSIDLTMDGDSITVSKTSSPDQERLLDLFIEKHQSSSPS
jgi:hypothetical protein